MGISKSTYYFEIKKVDVVKDIIHHNIMDDINNEEKTCPNCKMAKMMLDKKGIKYVAVDEEEENSF